jgi:hypothetical protein
MTSHSSNASIVDAVLTILDRSSVRWVALQDDPAAARVEGVRTDLDIAATVTVSAVISAHYPALAKANLTALMLTEYDIGGAEAVWLHDIAGGGTLQLDILADRRGLGRLGLPIDSVLDAPVEGRPLHQISREWALGYQVSKRLHKREWRRLATYRAAGMDADRVDVVFDEIFGFAGPRIVALIRGHACPSDWRAIAALAAAGRVQRRMQRSSVGPLEIGWKSFRRIGHRLLHPVGFWVHFSGTEAGDVAKACAEDMSHSLSTVLVSNEPIRLLGLLGSPARVRRPRLVVTFSDSPAALRRLRPNFLVDEARDWKSARPLLLDAMERHVTARIGLVNRQVT